MSRRTEREEEKMSWFICCAEFFKRCSPAIKVYNHFARGRESSVFKERRRRNLIKLWAPGGSAMQWINEQRTKRRSEAATKRERERERSEQWRRALQQQSAKMNTYDYDYTATMECRDNGILRGAVKNNTRGYYLLHSFRSVLIFS